MGLSPVAEIVQIGQTNNAMQCMRWTLARHQSLVLDSRCMLCLAAEQPAQPQRQDSLMMLIEALSRAGSKVFDSLAEAWSI